MSHGPATEWKENKTLDKKKARLGVVMFIIYTIIYAGFIYINVMDSSIMRINIGSFNVAIVYGFGLIILALVLAIIYNKICTNAEKLTVIDGKR
ncbi:DUF485 domain-containing protein [Desulfosporosinus sp. OT]|uniref:DUF485 domain-containing protein n=1 Tax=Desulfosporosinus sp. OT TaxID=913865 RepID=UPI000223AC96|nr:DUF485 domain-containing protein [Desulfosporosinus sp. OT]EGW37601.1 hypothetical protein DOT_4540 [Desulfosporosinus sp. OT]